MLLMQHELEVIFRNPNKEGNYQEDSFSAGHGYDFAIKSAFENLDKNLNKNGSVFRMMSRIK